MNTEDVEKLARLRGVSDVAIKAWKSIKGAHDFMPWEFDNKTGELKRGPGCSGVTGRIQSPSSTRRQFMKSSRWRWS